MSDPVTAGHCLAATILGLSLVILNGAERSEESLKYSIASRRFRDFSLPAVAQNDIRAKVLNLQKRGVGLKQTAPDLVKSEAVGAKVRLVSVDPNFGKAL